MGGARVSLGGAQLPVVARDYAGDAGHDRGRGGALEGDGGVVARAGLEGGGRGAEGRGGEPVGEVEAAGAVGVREEVAAALAAE